MNRNVPSPFLKVMVCWSILHPSRYDEQREIAHMLAVDPQRIHCRSMLVGGGFGGKRHERPTSCRLDGLAPKLPVKVKFHAKRASTSIPNAIPWR